jgi:hypothetical protein
MLPGRYRGEVRKAKYEGERLPHKWPGQEEKNFLRG